MTWWDTGQAARSAHLRPDWEKEGHTLERPPRDPTVNPPRKLDDALAPLRQAPADARIPRWLPFGVGIVAAVMVAELALRLITTPLDNVWAPIGPDTLGVREVRRFTEAIAVSHFSQSRARLTGHPHLIDAPTGVIVGDSHVEAVEVSDDHTMGAVLEESLRRSGQRINVRQYGWTGEDVPKYVQVGPDIMHVWDPVWVVVVLTASDLGPGMLHGRVRLVQQSDGHWAAIGHSSGGPSGRLRRTAEHALSRSVLLYHLAKRAQAAGLPLEHAARQPGRPSTRPSRVPLPERALIGLTALRETYGSRLRVLFAADVGLDGISARSPAEDAVLAACDSLAIRCANTRARMTHDRQDAIRLSRGFMNSPPGEGHLNDVGHALAAETILEDLISRRGPRSRAALLGGNGGQPANR
jgi:hypothetical protein